MGLFNKKQPEVGDPVFIDMRISEEQLSEEVLSLLRGQMWFMGFPEKLSAWAISTLGIDNDPNVHLMPRDGQLSDAKNGKTVREILIPNDLMVALSGKSDPNNLVFEFEEWERTRCNALAENSMYFLAHAMEQEGVTERDFQALIVPDFSGASGPPGHDFHWYVVFHPKPINDLEYIVYGRAPMLGKPTLGGYELAVSETLELFNSGKAVPGLIKALIKDNQILVRYYLPLEIVEATGWWADEEEGVPSSMLRTI